MGSNGELEEIDVSKLDPKWHDFMRAALVEWRATVFSVRRRLGGRSGATVLLVDLTTPKHDGQGVLKLSDDDALGDEHAHLEEVLRLAPRPNRPYPAGHASSRQRPHVNDPADSRGWWSIGSRGNGQARRTGHEFCQSTRVGITTISMEQSAHIPFHDIIGEYSFKRMA